MKYFCIRFSASLKLGLTRALFISFVFGNIDTFAQQRSDAETTPGAPSSTSSSNGTQIVPDANTQSSNKTQKKKKITRKSRVSNGAKRSAPKRVVADPIDLQKEVKIRIPKYWRKKGSTLRITNLTTGKQATLTLDDEEFISSDIVKSLTDGSSKLLVPQFSILTGIKRTGRINAPSDPSLSSSFRKEKFLYTQPVWRPVPFALRKLPGGGTQIYIDTKETTIVLSPEAAARRRNLRESQGIRKLFDVAFQALAQRRFDVSLQAFDRLLAKRAYLSEVQLRQASLGHGISSFHQVGCKAIEADFKIADQDPKNYDDVSYYRALCFVEAKRFDDAAGLFRDLAKRQSPVYAEQARFYVGVVAENQEKYDEAESAYLDTVDFANDPRVVALAKERLEIVKRLRAERNYERKWFALSVSGALGYDTNVVSLPQGLSPADYNLSNVKSLSYMGLGSFILKPKFSNRMENNLRYTGLILHYQDSELSSSSDLTSHDVAMSADFSLNSKNAAGFNVGYNSVFLGPLKTAGEYLATAYVEAHWSHLYGEPAAPVGDSSYSFKYSMVNPRFASATPASDSTANSYFFSYRYFSRKSLPSVWGPGFDLEFRPASGADNSYFSTALTATWSQPIGGEKSTLFMSHEAAVQDSFYYERTVKKRNDAVIRYTGSLSSLWWQSVEAKLQFIGTLSYSNISNFSYNKMQINFLVSTAF